MFKLFKSILNLCNRLHNTCNRLLELLKILIFKIQNEIDYTLMVIDYQWLISKNTFPKVTILQVTCFWRFFQNSQLFKWLALKKLPRVTSFDLSHQEIINMWPWHEFQKWSIIFESSIFQSFFNIISQISFNQSFNIFFHLFQHFLQKNLIHFSSSF